MLSGGIDSTVTAALCARALGPERVLALFTPEADSDPESQELGRLAADAFGVESLLEDITPSSTAARCYERRNEAVSELIPEFTSDWKLKIVLPSVLGERRPAHSSSSSRSRLRAAKKGAAPGRRLPRDRRCHELQAAKSQDDGVLPRRSAQLRGRRHAQPTRVRPGFFVKIGDGAADVKPIAHLYKTQVYALAEFLDVPEAIRSRQPTTDTYSLPQSQEEFYFSLPYEQMDLCLYAHNQGLQPEAVAEAVGISSEDVGRVYRDIEQKRRTTRYLHLPPQLIDAGRRGRARRPTPSSSARRRPRPDRSQLAL